MARRQAAGSSCLLYRQRLDEKHVKHVPDSGSMCIVAEDNSS